MIRTDKAISPCLSVLLKNRIDFVSCDITVLYPIDEKQAPEWKRNQDFFSTRAKNKGSG
jgi:hypothetical protein